MRSLISHSSTRNQSGDIEPAKVRAAMKANGMRSIGGEPLRWESALEPLLGARTGGLWRLHSDAVNATLLARWLPPCGEILACGGSTVTASTPPTLRRCPRRSFIRDVERVPTSGMSGDAPRI